MIRFVRDLHLVSDALPETGPVVFHCAAGKDRTGILAALILGGLGVDDATICADYDLTNAAMERMRRWVESSRPEMRARMHGAPSYMMAARSEAIAVLLDDIRRSHGSVREFLSAIGVGSVLLDELADTVTA